MIMKKSILYSVIISTLFIFFSIQLAANTEYENSQAFLENFLDAKEVLFEEISVQQGKAVWNLYSDEAEADQMTPRERFLTLFNNDTLNSIVEYWYTNRDKTDNQTLKRRVVVWRNILTAAKVNFAEDIFKLQNDLEVWLTEEDSSENTPSDDELDSMALDLMRMRNEKSKDLGYKNYAELILDVTELGADWFYNFISLVDSLTLKPYQQLIDDLKEEKNEQQIEYSDVRKLVGRYYKNSYGPKLAEVRTMAAIKETTDNIGIDYETLPVRFVEKEMPRGIGGQGIAVQIPSDFRIATEPGLSLEAKMHELGHGLQAIFTEVTSPILKGYEWCIGNDCGGYAEGMAEISAKLIHNTEWLKKYSDFTEDEIRSRKEIVNMYKCVYLRFQLSIIMREIELYKNLEQNPQELRANLIKKYLLVNDSPKQPVRLANMIYVSYPIYVYSYLAADILSWQVHTLLESKFGKEYVFNKNVGPFLKENFYKNGELYTWQTRIRMATGKELDVRGYLKSINLN
jgi:hypothetical protein